MEVGLSEAEQPWERMHRTARDIRAQAVVSQEAIIWTVPVTAQTKPAQTRLDHIFAWVMAAIRTQGYQEGYICPKCEKTKGIDTREVKALCKKYLTPEYFEARKNVRVIVASEEQQQ